MDKYVASMMLVERHGLPSETLRRVLYRNYELRAGLSEEQTRRYHHANRLANRYSARLERSFIRRRDIPAMLRELRRFYRASYARKHGIIAAAA